MGTETRTRIALAALLAATLLTYELLFESDGYVGPAVLGSLLAMGIAALARRWGAGPFLTFEVSLAALFWYLTLVFQAAESFWGLPTPDAGTGLARLISAAVDASAVDYEPVPVRAGYVILIVVGFWLATTLAEVATFRWRRPILAALPCMILFSVPVVAGSSSGAVFFLATFLIALLTFWATESSHRLRSWGRWVTTWSNKKKEDEPQQVTGGLARRMGGACVLATLVAPMFLPTVGNGWLPWRNDTGGGSGSGGGGGDVNLLVDIAPKLLEQSDQNLFNVTATDSAYWRLASLVEFDGRQWHEASGDRVVTDEFISSGTPGAGAAVENLAQQVDIVALDGEFTPAAVQPMFIDGRTVAYDRESFDLQVDDVDAEDTYTVISEIVKPTYNELSQARTVTPASGANIDYTDTQGTISPAIERLRDSWIEGARGDFEQLLRIQEILRGPEYQYSTQVEFKESDNYLEDFLLETRRGFCQQFATAFALLARSLGHPTRISVGFLPGSQTPAIDGGTLHTVKGTDAHAWPEVYFEDFGWVAFEPTARGLSAIPIYTIPPSGTLDDIRNAGGGGGPSGGPAPDDPDAQPGRQPPNPAIAPPVEEPPPAVEDPAWRQAFWRLAVALGVFTMLWVFVVPLLKRERNKRRYRRAQSPAQTALASWAQFEDDASEMYVPRGAAESANAFVKRLAEEGRVTATASTRLATLYETAAYSPSGLDRDGASEAKRLARILSSELWARSSMWQRVARLFSIRSLLPHGRRRGLRLSRPRTAT